LLELEMQIKFGCNFGVDMDGIPTADATIWVDEYTTWWNVDQYVSSPGTNDGNADLRSHLTWGGNVEGSGSWSQATPKPSPYIFIYSSPSCTNEEKTEVGMIWGTEKELIAPAENQEAIKSKAQVLSMIVESELTSSERLDAKILESERSAKTASDIAIIAACLSGVIFSIFMSLFCFRAAKPNEFRRLLLSDMDGASEIGGGKSMLVTTGEERI
jgi:hypothetical protein